MKILRLISFALVAATAGCDSEGIVRPPQTEIRIFNAASNLGTIALLREESLAAQLEYGSGRATEFDAGQYDFNVEFNRIGVGVTRTFSFSETLDAELAYTFVLVAPSGEPEAFVATSPTHDDEAETTRWTIVHAFEGLGELDVYVEDEGTDLATVTPAGRVAYGANALSFEVTPRFSRLFLTTAGDPTDILFQSFDQVFLPGIAEYFVVSDPGDRGTLDIEVSRVQSNTGRMGQIGQTSETRAINGISDRLERDVYLDDTMSPALFPALPFGQLTNYVDVEPISHNIITTPLGNPGTEEASIDWFFLPGRVFTILIAGDNTDGIVQSVVTEDKRSIDGQATFRIYNTAHLFDRVSVYIVPPGTDITATNPNVELGAPAATPRNAFIPGDYELWVEDVDPVSVLAGPIPVTMNDGGVYGMLLLNGADGNTIEVDLFDDFDP